MRLTRFDIGVDLSKRNFLKAGGMAGIGAITIGTVACGKNLSPYVSIIIGALQELKPLIPGQSAILDRAVSIAKAFDEAYRAGKFADAMAVFENLASVITEVYNAAGGASDAVKSALAVVGVALRTIAVLLKQQAQDPVVAEAVSRAAGPRATAQKALVERLAEPATIDALLKASRP